MHFELANALQILERTPHTFRALLNGLPEAWTSPNEGPETFSAFDNLGHLVHGEKTDWIPRARLILNQGVDTRFEPFDRFAQYQESRDKSVEELLTEFAQLRASNLDTLRGWNISQNDLALEGEHPELGRVTLRQLLATWVVHDLGTLPKPRAFSPSSTGMKSGRGARIFPPSTAPDLTRNRGAFS